MPDVKMVVLGDSVPWGQGLTEPQKFYSLVDAELNEDGNHQPPIVLAHSGAIIGVGFDDTTAPIDGEVPTAFPTIIRQCETFADSPESVDVVLLNGGLNDLNFRVLLNPFTDSNHLRERIRQHCFRDMKDLLATVTGKFTKPTAKIVVTGYYPILSVDSRLPLVPDFLAMHGVGISPFFNPLGDNLLDKIIANCQQFFVQSSNMLEKSVNKTNQEAGSTRVFFAQPPFTAANAALASDPWLWGVNPDFTAQDPVKDQRRVACDLFESDPIRRLTCHRASAGHPNVTGARKFADAILAALG